MSEHEAKPRPKKNFLCPHCGIVMYKDWHHTNRGTPVGPCIGLACRESTCRNHAIPLEDLPKDWQEYLSQFSVFIDTIKCNDEVVNPYSGGEYGIISDQVSATHVTRDYNGNVRGD